MYGLGDGGGGKGNGKGCVVGEEEEVGGRRDLCRRRGVRVERGSTRRLFWGGSWGTLKANGYMDAWILKKARARGCAMARVMGDAERQGSGLRGLELTFHYALGGVDRF